MLCSKLMLWVMIALFSSDEVSSELNKTKVDRKQSVVTTIVVNQNQKAFKSASFKRPHPPTYFNQRVRWNLLEKIQDKVYIGSDCPTQIGILSNCSNALIALCLLSDRSMGPSPLSSLISLWAKKMKIEARGYWQFCARRTQIRLHDMTCLFEDLSGPG